MIGKLLGISLFARYWGYSMRERELIETLRIRALPESSYNYNNLLNLSDSIVM